MTSLHRSQRAPDVYRCVKKPVFVEVCCLEGTAESLQREEEEKAGIALVLQNVRKQSDHYTANLLGQIAFRAGPASIFDSPWVGGLFY